MMKAAKQAHSFAGEKPGMAQTAKLANNLLAATAMVATSRS